VVRLSDLTPEEQKEHWELVRSKLLAHRAVYCEVTAGRMPGSHTLRCIKNCGKHAWVYHHHLGYAEEHWLDVIPMCGSCHRQAHNE